MKLDDLLDIDELLEKKAIRKKVVRGGKVKKKKTCPDGYKLEDGKCVKQSQSEKKTRSKAARRGNRKSKAQRKRSQRKSNRVRDRRNL